MNRRFWVALVFAAITAICAGCSDDDDEPWGDSPCRYDPERCFGSPGGFCDSNVDCQGGFCCTEQSNCGGGMCTYSCDRDADCPPDMGCEHQMCFFFCRSARDCANGQRCEHRGVCEWP